MKLGVMQPYFFPYLPYWQLIKAVDLFVVYDDVTYIKNGYINRNSILVNGSPSIFTVPLSKASSFKKINEIERINDCKTSSKLLKTVQMAYKKAPFFKDVFPLVEDFFLSTEPNIVYPLVRQIRNVSSYLNIQTPIILSSSLTKDDTLAGQEKIIDICKRLNASTYINAIGGRTLYEKEKFKDQGLELFFLKGNQHSYKQFKNSFVPNLSILDILMFNSKEEVIRRLEDYELV
ncbi:WbqC family protein [Turicimonas muris]|uniref:WbqC family protein n=1 Tax=Turicimonas muris TaxID=1796652 RepID=UPI00248B3A3D|nr:WbqC family protein [Turicimonas muris]MBS4768414.1 WbqC family protein [Burkholderiales bacterium]